MRTPEHITRLAQLESKFADRLKAFYTERSKARIALWLDLGSLYKLNESVLLPDGRIGAVEQVSNPDQSGFSYKVRRELQSGSLTISAWIHESDLKPYSGKYRVRQKQAVQQSDTTKEVKKNKEAILAFLKQSN